jgi:uncharacterized protein (DUF2236 family)
VADFFPRDSVIRRVNIEPALFFGAGRALLLQLAHPAVAQGVADHSDFKRNPFKRLQGTLEATYATVFGSEQLALGVGRRIQRIHDYVTGPNYRANDPVNLMWVHATLVDTALGCYTTLRGPLSPTDAETYYREMTRVAEVFGLPQEAQPETLAAFREYFDETVAGLQVTDTGRDLGAFVVDPELPLGLHVPLAPPLSLHRLFTIGMTPESLRDQFAFEWDDRAQARLDRAGRVIRTAGRLTPGPIRIGPNVLWGRVLLRQAARHVQQFEMERTNPLEGPGSAIA